MREASGSRASGRSECSGHASSSLLDCLGRGMAAIDEDGEEPGNDHQRKPNCGSPAISGPLTPVTSGLSRTPHPAGQAQASLVSGDATAHEDFVLSVDVDDIDAVYALARATGLLPDDGKCQASIADVHSAFRSGS